MNIIVSTLAIVCLAATCVLACLLARLYEVTAGCKIDVLAPLSWAAGVLLFVIGFSLPSVVAADHLVLRALLGATFGGFAGLVLMSAWKSQKTKMVADAQRRQREAEEHALKRAEIIANVVSPGLPEVLVERMWGYAWQEGHSTGYGDVEAVLSDLDDMLRGLTITVKTSEACSQEPRPKGDRVRV